MHETLCGVGEGTYFMGLTDVPTSIPRPGQARPPESMPHAALSDASNALCGVDVAWWARLPSPAVMAYARTAPPPGVSPGGTEASRQRRSARTDADEAPLAPGFYDAAVQHSACLNRAAAGDAPRAHRASAPSGPRRHALNFPALRHGSVPRGGQPARRSRSRSRRAAGRRMPGARTAAGLARLPV